MAGFIDDGYGVKLVNMAEVPPLYEQAIAAVKMGHLTEFAFTHADMAPSLVLSWKPSEFQFAEADTARVIRRRWWRK